MYIIKKALCARCILNTILQLKLIVEIFNESKMIFIIYFSCIREKLFPASCILMNFSHSGSKI